MSDAAYWQSPSVLAHVGDATHALVHMFLGVFLYDCLLSLRFDWQLLSGKRRLRLVHAAYFGAKLAMLGYCIVIMTMFWAQTEIDCRVAFYFIELFMGITAFTTSTLLAFRTVCVYQGRQQQIVKVAVTIMTALLLAAWMYGVRDVLWLWSTAPDHAPYAEGACSLIELKQRYWVKYVVTIVFDATILLLTVVGLWRTAGATKSRIGKLLLRQGIIFFVITLLVNLLITAFTVLHLNDAMSLLPSMPQSVICVICSCRLYRVLIDDLYPNADDDNDRTNASNGSTGKPSLSAVTSNTDIAVYAKDW